LTDRVTDLLHSLIPYFGCVIQKTAEGLQLTGADRHFMNAAAITPRTFQAPFTVRTVAKTDSTNLRLYWHLGEIILNWECSVRELRVHDPRTREQHGLEGAGFITTNEWHEVVWEITRHAMQLVVDGTTRYAGAGDYSAIDAPVGIGPCFGSTVTVREFTVTPG
jgi:hypothetical protein